MAGKDPRLEEILNKQAQQIPLTLEDKNYLMMSQSTGMLGQYQPQTNPLNASLPFIQYGMEQSNQNISPQDYGNLFDEGMAGFNPMVLGSSDKSQGIQPTNNTTQQGSPSSNQNLFNPNVPLAFGDNYPTNEEVLNGTATSSTTGSTGVGINTGTTATNNPLTNDQMAQAMGALTGSYVARDANYAASITANENADDVKGEGKVQGRRVGSIQLGDQANTTDSSTTGTGKDSELVRNTSDIPGTEGSSFKNQMSKAALMSNYLGAGIDLNSSLYLLGKGLGSKGSAQNTMLTAGAAGKSLLAGSRSLLSGLSFAKRGKYTDDYMDDQYRKSILGNTTEATQYGTDVGGGIRRDGGTHKGKYEDGGTSNPYFGDLFKRPEVEGAVRRSGVVKNHPEEIPDTRGEEQYYNRMDKQAELNQQMNYNDLEPKYFTPSSGSINNRDNRSDFNMYPNFKGAFPEEPQPTIYDSMDNRDKRSYNKKGGYKYEGGGQTDPPMDSTNVQKAPSTMGDLFNLNLDRPEKPIQGVDVIPLQERQQLPVERIGGRGNFEFNFNEGGMMTNPNPQIESLSKQIQDLEVPRNMQGFGEMSAEENMFINDISNFLKGGKKYEDGGITPNKGENFMQFKQRAEASGISNEGEGNYVDLWNNNLPEGEWAVSYNRTQTDLRGDSKKVAPSKSAVTEEEVSTEENPIYWEETNEEETTVEEATKKPETKKLEDKKQESTATTVSDNPFEDYDKANAAFLAEKEAVAKKQEKFQKVMAEAANNPNYKTKNDPGGHACATAACEMMREAGFTLPEDFERTSSSGKVTKYKAGDPVPIVSGNAKWRSMIKNFGMGFQEVPLEEAGAGSIFNQVSTSEYDPNHMYAGSGETDEYGRPLSYYSTGDREVFKKAYYPNDSYIDYTKTFNYVGNLPKLEKEMQEKLEVLNQMRRNNDLVQRVEPKRPTSIDPSQMAGTLDNNLAINTVDRMGNLSESELALINNLSQYMDGGKHGCGCGKMKLGGKKSCGCGGKKYEDGGQTSTGYNAGDVITFKDEKGKVVSGVIKEMKDGEIILED